MQSQLSSVVGPLEHVHAKVYYLPQVFDYMGGGFQSLRRVGMAVCVRCWGPHHAEDRLARDFLASCHAMYVRHGSAQESGSWERRCPGRGGEERVSKTGRVTSIWHFDS